jgi:K+-transporting ATPase A subunit
MKIKNFILRIVFFVVPLFLLNLYGNPEQSTKSRIFFLILLIMVAIINAFFGTWIEKKYPYQSSYKPKNESNLETTAEKITE